MQLACRKNGQLIYRCVECTHQLFTPDSQNKARCSWCGTMMEFLTTVLAKGSKIHVRKIQKNR